MALHCTECGFVNVEGANYCQRCGALLPRAEGAGEPASPPIDPNDPATVPKAVDVITPPGVSQATELDPTRGPVVIQPVTVP